MKITLWWIEANLKLQVLFLYNAQIYKNLDPRYILPGCHFSRHIKPHHPDFCLLIRCIKCKLVIQWCFFVAMSSSLNGNFSFSVGIGWRMRSWIQDSLEMFVTYELKKNSTFFVKMAAPFGNVFDDMVRYIGFLYERRPSQAHFCLLNGSLREWKIPHSHGMKQNCLKICILECCLREVKGTKATERAKRMRHWPEP